MSYYSENDNLSFLSLDKNIYSRNDIHERLDPNFYNIVYEEESIDNQRLYMNNMNEKDNNKKNSYEKSTSFKTNLNYSTRDLNFYNEDNINNKDYPKFCSLFEIKDLITNKLDISKCNEIIKNIKYNKRVEEGENNLQLIRKKRERPNVEEYDNIYDINPKNDKENNHKRGPKTRKYNYKKEEKINNLNKTIDSLTKENQNLRLQLLKNQEKNDDLNNQIEDQLKQINNLEKLYKEEKEKYEMINLDMQVKEKKEKYEQQLKMNMKLVNEKDLIEITNKIAINTKKENQLIDIVSILDEQLDLIEKK